MPNLREKNDNNLTTNDALGCPLAPQFESGESPNASSDYGEYDPHVEWPWRDAGVFFENSPGSTAIFPTNEVVERQKTDVFNLDIQSYLLRFGDLKVDFWGPNAFLAGVWMSRVMKNPYIELGIVSFSCPKEIT